MKTVVNFIIRCNWVKRRFSGDSYNVGVQWTSWRNGYNAPEHMNRMIWEAKETIAKQCHRL